MPVHPASARPSLPPVRALLLATVLAAGLLPAAVPRAAAVAPAAAQESLLATVYPESATLGAPSWVSVGTHATWYVSAASVANSRFGWVEDPAGTWEDPSTGKRYRRTDESGEGVGGMAGEGYAALDVVEATAPSVVAAWNLYGLDRQGGTLTPLTLGGGVMPGAVVDGAWMHPTLLKRFLETGFGDLQVLAGPYPLGGRTYDAVSLVSDSASGYQSWTWDRATGILLVSSSRQDGAFSPFSAPDGTTPQANSQITYRQFLGTRQRDVPGLGAALPEWVERTPVLRYSGTWTFTNPLDPASGTRVFPMTTQATFSGGGATWKDVRYRNDIDMNGVPSATEGVALATGTGSWWWDPAALAEMRQGQVLDDDPILGSRSIVEGEPAWPGGRSVMLRTELPGNLIRAQYDGATGVLLWMEVTQDSSGTVMAVALDTLP